MNFQRQIIYSFFLLLYLMNGCKPKNLGSAVVSNTPTESRKILKKFGIWNGFVAQESGQPSELGCSLKLTSMSESKFQGEVFTSDKVYSFLGEFEQDPNALSPEEKSKHQEMTRKPQFSRGDNAPKIRDYNGGSALYDDVLVMDVTTYSGATTMLGTLFRDMYIERVWIRARINDTGDFYKIQYRGSNGDFDCINLKKTNP